MPYHIDHYRVRRTTYCRLPTPNKGTSSFGLARFARKDGPDFARSSSQLRALAYLQVTVSGLLRYHHHYGPETIRPHIASSASAPSAFPVQQPKPERRLPARCTP